MVPMRPAAACERLRSAAAFVRSRTDVVPAVGIVLGTGIEGLASAVAALPDVLEYSEIPASRAAGTLDFHAGRLLLG